MKLILLAVWGSAMFGQVAEWKLEPQDFKGVRFGSPQKDVPRLATIGVNDCVPDYLSKMAFCSSHLEATFIIPINFVCYEQKLSGVVGSFPSEHFSDVLEMLTAKYGEPHARESSEVQNRMGAKFPQEVFRWEGKTIVITLKRFGKTADQGSFVIFTKESLRKQEEDDQATKKNVF